jgi:hypothetical protein
VIGDDDERTVAAQVPSTVTLKVLEVVQTVLKFVKHPLTLAK